MRTNILGEMSWTEAKAAAEEDPIVLLPIGAIEQHGPHLPLHEDSIVAEWVAKYVMNELKDKMKILVAPTQYYGCSPIFRGYTGALTLSSETLTLVIKEILEGIINSGFKRIILINNNGGNVGPATTASLNLRWEHDVLIGHLYPWQLGYEIMREEYEDSAAVYGHGAEPEHSAMLAMYPDQVQTEKAKKGPEVKLSGWNPGGYTLAKIPRQSTLGTVFWDFSEISSDGVSGDPSFGNKAMGDKWVEKVMGFCCDYIREYDKNTRDGKSERKNN